MYGCTACCFFTCQQELILFSRADLERSIPSVVDGLKPGQRKILYCCFKRNLKKDIKVRHITAC
jgi:DNA topoisomerase-2